MMQPIEMHHGGDGRHRRAPLPPTPELAWLARVTETAHDHATPVGAFLAALPAAPKRRAKTSSERGRAFRERQQQRERQLQDRVSALQREIQRLYNQRKIAEARCLHSKTSATGSLVRTIYEYHRLFRHGLQELPCRVGQLNRSTIERIRQQEEFIRRIMDPAAMVGSMEGPEASIVQWRRYTKSHAGITAAVVTAEVHETTKSDDEDVVTVVAQCTLRARFSRETFASLFPHVLSNEAFLQRFIGSEVEYTAVKRFQFTSEGCIAVESVDVDFVGGLLRAGCTLSDIAILMGGAAITPESMIVEAEADGDGDDRPDHQVLLAHEKFNQQSAAETRPLLGHINEPTWNRRESGFVSSDGLELSPRPIGPCRTHHEVGTLPAFL